MGFFYYHKLPWDLFLFWSNINCAWWLTKSITNEYFINIILQNDVVVRSILSMLTCFDYFLWTELQIDELMDIMAAFSLWSFLCSFFWFEWTITFVYCYTNVISCSSNHVFQNIALRCSQPSNLTIDVKNEIYYKCFMKKLCFRANLSCLVL